MLPCKYLFENFDLAHEALAHWSHEEELLEQFRISSNAVYPFRWKGRVCFLRLAPVEEKQEGNLRGELEFLAYLEAQGYPAVRPLPADSGETLLRLETRWGAYYATAFLGVPGIRLDKLSPTPALLRSYGRALGKLHALSSDYRPACPKWGYAQVLAWAEAALARYGASQELLAQAAPPCAGRWMPCPAPRIAMALSTTTLSRTTCSLRSTPACVPPSTLTTGCSTGMPWTWSRSSIPWTTWASPTLPPPKRRF